METEGVTGQWFRPNGEPADVPQPRSGTPIFEQLVAETQAQQQPADEPKVDGPPDPLVGAP